MAEFKTPEALIEATTPRSPDGYRKMDAYTPVPGGRTARGAGIGADVGVDAWCCWADCRVRRRIRVDVLDHVHRLPDECRGRPFYSWPAYIPPTFETTVLLASLTAVSGCWR